MLRGVLVMATIAVAAGVCNIAEKKDVKIGGCPKRTYKYGSCTSLDDAQAKLTAMLTKYQDPTPPQSDAECKDLIDKACVMYGGTGDASKCSDYCTAMFPSNRGCTMDEQCMMPGFQQPLTCCGYYKSVAKDNCKIETKTLDAYIQKMRESQQCGDLNCVARASSSASVSFVMVFLSSIVGLFVAARM
ncbi:hypothetical protein GUITHDRAFT_117798 [Guillardia theta CCMP2712]|uniref:Uncharacterized protein n=1 Tax=Guillardia theta (strain CCMP2712) TaxID=905079 RepID=L1IIC9_GUITC|nr:hypothetical protein GUITHDRAFT_117798 [Guillardia theta CCMP2712]EKX36013.1 hypothetical protein GUITHDRAFT_117798 [Guillardia theta CCMP2712]|eukprot:XP_005822993.1 hypothetical protein GUITHDRAFT_117798 [Guillardia theta CCMP2712]